MASKLWWLIHKDLVVEYRTRQAWPAMLVLGILVAAVFSLQVELPPQQWPAVSAALLWLAILFAGLVVFERSFAAEKHDGCWDGLALYPLPRSMIYLSKLVSNFIALLALECVLVPLFAVLSDVPLLRHPWPMMLVAVLASMGLAAVGTLVSALTHGLRQQGAVLSLLVLPLVVPVVLAASQATRLVTEYDLGEAWWRWVQFLAGFAIIFTTLGVVLFGFLVED